MSETQIKLGNALLKRLVELKQDKGELNIEDVGALFESMADSLKESSELDTFLRKEIEKLAQYITFALQEIASITPDDDEDEEEPSPKNLSYANAELDAVVKATEQATNDILDAADVIQEKVGTISGHDDAAAAVNDATMKIYDACNFQDITGQRINKVLRTLDYLDTKLNKLKQFIDERSQISDEDLEDFKDKRPDAHLMSGPQLPDDLPSQDDIDKLFANS